MVFSNGYQLALLLGLSTLTLLVPAQQDTDTFIQVETTHGSLRGKQFMIENDPVNGFFGVQYAEAPMTSFRWRQPRYKRRWGGVKDALTSGPVCPQLEITSGNLTGHEDCLYMDIVVGDVDKDSLKPVLVYINNDNHYQTGISHTGALLANREGLLVVTVNSRLGALGYLYDGPSTGNMGLWDNIRALQYIQDNIEAFGGDPDKVTIMGVDSGAAIAQLLAASPVTDGLLHQVIAMSPLNVNIAGLSDMDGRKVLRELAGCNDEQMVTCDIRNVKVEDIVNNITNCRPNTMDPVLFPDGFNFDRLKRYNYLTGVTTAEELLLSHNIVEEEYPAAAETGLITQQDMDSILKSACSALFEEMMTQNLCVCLLKKEYYLNHYAPYTVRQVERIISPLFHSNFITTLDMHTESENASTYAYVVSASEDPSVIGIREQDNYATDKSIMMKLAFGYPYLAYGGKFSFLDQMFYGNNLLTSVNPTNMFGGREELRPQSQDVMRYWANFVKAGNPSGLRKVDIDWPTYSKYIRTGTFLTLGDGEVRLTYRFPRQRDYVYFNDVFHDAMSQSAEEEKEMREEKEDKNMEAPEKDEDDRSNVQETTTPQIQQDITGEMDPLSDIDQSNGTSPALGQQSQMTTTTSLRPILTEFAESIEDELEVPVDPAGREDKEITTSDKTTSIIDEWTTSVDNTTTTVVYSLNNTMESSEISEQTAEESSEVDTLIDLTGDNSGGNMTTSGNDGNGEYNSTSESTEQTAEDSREVDTLIDLTGDSREGNVTSSGYDGMTEYNSTSDYDVMGEYNSSSESTEQTAEDSREVDTLIDLTGDSREGNVTTSGMGEYNSTSDYSRTGEYNSTSELIDGFNNTATMYYGQGNESLLEDVRTTTGDARELNQDETTPKSDEVFHKDGQLGSPDFANRK